MPGLSSGDPIATPIPRRYSDCPTVSSSVRIEASADRVWSLVSDISLPTRFSSELCAVEWSASVEVPGVGARFVGHSAHPAIGEWQTTCVVTVFDRNRCFEWRVGDPDRPSSIWRFTIVPLDDSAVTLEQWFQMGPARSGLNAAIDAMPDKEARIVERRLGEHGANMQLTLEGIKQLAEAVG